MRVDVGDLERRDLGDAQARAVGDRKRRQMLQADRRIKEPADLVRAEDVRQAARIAQPHQLAGEIGPVDRLDEEEAQGRDDGVHRWHAETGLLHGDLKTAQVLSGRRIGRAFEKGGQAPHVAQIIALRRARETPHGHVVDQTLAQRADRGGGNGQSVHGLAP